MDPYDVLQVSPAAEADVIDAAYKRLVFKHHPDRNKAPDATARLREINAAYEVLRDPERRALHDARRMAARRAAAAGPSAATAPSPGAAPRPTPDAREAWRPAEASSASVPRPAPAPSQWGASSIRVARIVAVVLTSALVRWACAAQRESQREQATANQSTAVRNWNSERVTPPSSPALGVQPASLTSRVTERGVSVDFPATPTRSFKSLPSPLGVLPTTSYQAELNGVYYSFAVTEYPTASQWDVSAGLEGGLNAMVEAMRKSPDVTSVSVLSRHQRNLGGIAGMEAVIRMEPGATSRAWMLMAPPRQGMPAISYALGIGTPNTNALDANISRFFASARLVWQ